MAAEDSDSDCSSQLPANKCVNDTGAGWSGASRRKNKNYDRDCISSGSGTGLQLPGTPTQGDNTETSDFDSVSTTSASYLVTQSDMESLSLDDNQLELLMNKSDLSDLDQLDNKTITGSCSSDEGSLMDQSGSKKVPRQTGRPGGDVVSDAGGDAGDGDGGDGGAPATDQATEGQDCQVSSQSGPEAPLSTAQAPPLGGAAQQQQNYWPVGSEPRERRQTEQNVKPGPSSPQPRDTAKPTISFSSADSERQERTKRKGSVSNLIARFEASSRSSTPERSLTPDSVRSLSSPAKQPPPEPEIREIRGEAVAAPARDTGARPKVKQESVSQQQPSGTTESLISNESERAELRGLKEFTEKYLRQQEARNAGSEAVEETTGQTADSDIEDLDGMPPTVRRNSGGAYTSYVFISSDPSNDDQASVVSSNGSYTDPENRVTVNVKETCVSPNTCVVSIQDGRTSNISIVSTESSELNSPRQSPTNMLEDPPELPTKVKVGGKSHSELQQIVYATRESLRDFSHRSRGGEADFERDFIDEDADRERSGELSSVWQSGMISKH